MTTTKESDTVAQTENIRDRIAGAMARGEFQASVGSAKVSHLEYVDSDKYAGIEVKITFEGHVSRDQWEFLTR